MSTSSSSSSLSALTGLKMSGTSLFSGLDTESIVKQMAAATKNKINSQQQKLDLLSWKQTTYRTVIDKINTFRDTYFNSLKPDTNISSNYIMAAYTSTSSNSKVSVTASSSATATTYNITNIQQLAKNAEITSDFTTEGSISNGINLDFSNAVSGTEYHLNIELDGLAKDITFKGGSNEAGTIANINAAIKTAFGETIGSKLQVDSSSNLKYTNADGDNILHTFIVQPSTTLDTGDDAAEKQQAAMEAVGLTDAVSSKITTGSKLEVINFKTELAGGSYSFTINGESFTFDKDTSIKEIISAVNANDNADVTLSFDSLGQKFTLKSNKEGEASSIELTQTSGNLLTAMFGSDVIKSGNQLSTVSLKDKGITGTSLLSSSPVTSTDFDDVKGSSINVTLNGVTKTIYLYTYDSNGDKYTYTTTADDDDTITTYGATNAVSALNEQLTREFGTDALAFKFDTSTGKISLNCSDLGDTVKVSLSENSGSAALLSKLGMTVDQTNEISGDNKLSELLSTLGSGTITIGDKTATIDANTTFEQLKTAFGDNISIDYNTGIISVNKQVTATSGNQDIVSQLFGTDYSSIENYSGTKTNDDGTYVDASEANNAVGKNAILTINGTTITNASNTIKIDGTNINIGNLSDTEAAAINDSDNVITIKTSRDTTKAYDAVVKFVDSYNTLISDLNTEISTKRPTSDGTTTGTKYDPLTEEQREEMSDTQIENWEEKAKTGLLYADNSISDFLMKIRNAMNTRTSDGFSLYDMGITVSSTYSDNGKLVIDETKLTTAFEKYPDKIQELFTDSAKGLSVNVSNAINSATSTKRGNYGVLTRLAGIANTASQAENSISTQIDAYNTTITALKEKYSDELDRYWSKFTYLETVMAKYNSQASLFTQSS